MPLVTIVNPSPRKGKKMATRKKARTAKQKAATRRLVAMNRRRARGASSPAPKRRARRRPARRANPAAPRVRRHRSGPRKGKHHISSRRAASRAGRVLRYRRPNPIDFMVNTLMPSVVGGAGALALDVVVGVLPLPDTLKTGPMAPLVKIVGAVGLGMLGSKMVNRRVGEQIAAGAITVQIYNFAKAQLIKFGGGKIPGLSMYPDGYLSAYVSGQEGLIGYTDSGMQVDNSMSGYESGVYR
jgi:hypothetical protein